MTGEREREGECRMGRKSKSKRKQGAAVEDDRRKREIGRGARRCLLQGERG